MVSRSLVLGVALMMAALSLAGCLSPKELPLEEAEVEDEEQPTTSPELPDGRGESAGIKETNRTEEGSGGIEHKHDYWKGKDQVVLYDEEVYVYCPPCMPDGEGTSPKGVAYVKLGDVPGEDRAALVFEGAEKVAILFGQPSLGEPGMPHPAPPGLFVQYRSAADSEWSEPLPVTYDQPVEISVTPQMTDMPHSTHSLWVFRITTDRVEQITVPMTVTVVKGREVVDWPGHPDFYADSNVRRVMDQHVTTHMSGLESAALYDSGGTWANPERLISWGTTDLHIIINITRVSNAYNAEATGFFLEAHDARVIGPEVTFGDRHREMNGNNDLSTYEFHIEVDPEGMDGPYQPQSRWGFRAMAVFGTLPDNPVANGLCPGCFPYDIEYDIVVFAISDPEKLKDHPQHM